ncbi:hypothetical protein CR513_01545, partial [Mucuna pruriens]
MVNEIGAVDNLRLENQLTELTSLVRQLAVGQHQPSIVARVCGICTSMEHPTDMCPALQETESDDDRDEVVSIRPTPSRPGQALQPNEMLQRKLHKGRLGIQFEELCTFQASFGIHIFPLSLSPFSCSHLLRYGGARCSQRRFSRLRKRKLGNEKPKVARWDRLGYQCTLVDLILNVLASGGEPSLWTMFINLCRDRIGPVPAESNSAHRRGWNTIENAFIKLTPLSGTQLEPAQTYELKSGLIHLLPKFHGLAGEDPHKHLKEFHVGILEAYRRHDVGDTLLDRAAKYWLYLQLALFNT